MVALLEELRKDAGWRDDWELLRWASLPLVEAEGAPDELVRELREMIDVLRRSAKWWKDLLGGTRTFVAGLLVARGVRAADCVAEVERARALLRAEGLRRGHSAEVLAILMLMEASQDGRVAAEHVQRLKQLFDRVRQDHSWLLGASEYPTLAFLAATDDGIEEMGTRVETTFRELREAGFRSSSALLMVPHLLYHYCGKESATGRFRALWEAFQGLGLRMNRADYDEVALLVSAPGSPAELARRVSEHRAVLRGLRKRPSMTSSFSLACATTFVELTERDPKARRLSLMQAAHQVRFVIGQRQAAAAAAAG